MIDKRVTDFHVNLKGAIKKKGYDLTSFPEKYLGCTYQAFNWRLKNGKFHFADILICIDRLNIEISDLVEQAPKPIKKESALVKPKNKDKKFDKLNSLLK
jgi:hypothetical protein